MTSREVRHARPRTIWEEGRRPGFEVVALTLALLLTVTVVQLLLADRLGLLFDLAFVALCVFAAIRVRLADFFTVGVLPPLAMLTAVALLAIGQPSAVAHRDDGVVQATISGLSTHSFALVAGYLMCLAVLAVRRAALGAGVQS